MVEEIEYEDYEDLPLYWIGYNDGRNGRKEALETAEYFAGYEEGKWENKLSKLYGEPVGD